MTTPKKKDRSMLYAALIGFALFALIPALLIGILSFLFSQPSSFFPEGTEVEVIDNIGGFPAFGTKKIVAHIPPEHSEAFAQKLRESGYVSTPVSPAVHSIDRYGDLSGLYSKNGLWCIYDDTSKNYPERWKSFTFELYDLDTCTYYSVHVLT